MKLIGYAIYAKDDLSVERDGISLSNDACDVINKRQIEGATIFVLFLSISKSFPLRANFTNVG